MKMPKLFLAVTLLRMVQFTSRVPILMQVCLSCLALQIFLF